MALRSALPKRTPPRSPWSQVLPAAVIATAPAPKAAVTDIEPIVRLWLLRILVALGGHEVERLRGQPGKPQPAGDRP